MRVGLLFRDEPWQPLQRQRHETLHPRLGVRFGLARADGGDKAHQRAPQIRTDRHRMQAPGTRLGQPDQTETAPPKRGLPFGRLRRLDQVCPP